jgi:hypothetical protein
MPMPCCFYHRGSIVCIEIGYCVLLALFFLLTIFVAIQSLLYFHMNFRIVFPSFVRMSLIF